MKKPEFGKRIKETMTTITPDAAGLRIYLKHIGDFAARNAHRPSLFSGPCDMVLRIGVDCEPQASLPPGIVRGEKRKCAMNSAHLAVDRPDLAYVEGYCLTDIGIPVEHAWCVDCRLRVVEPTYDKCGFAYRGIVLDRKWMLRRIISAGHYGVLTVHDGLDRGWQKLFEKGLPTTAFHAWHKRLEPRNGAAHRKKGDQANED